MESGNGFDTWARRQELRRALLKAGKCDRCGPHRWENETRANGRHKWIGNEIHGKWTFFPAKPKLTK